MSERENAKNRSVFVDAIVFAGPEKGLIFGKIQALLK